MSDVQLKCGCWAHVDCCDYVTRRIDENAERHAALVSERDAAIARAKDAEAWVADLQAGMYVNCVYCGHRYGSESETPVSMADVLKAHIEQCPKHPLSEVRARLEALADKMSTYGPSCVRFAGELRYALKGAAR